MRARPVVWVSHRISLLCSHHVGPTPLVGHPGVDVSTGAGASPSGEAALAFMVLTTLSFEKSVSPTALCSSPQSAGMLPWWQGHRGARHRLLHGRRAGHHAGPLGPLSRDSSVNAAASDCTGDPRAVPPPPPRSSSDTSGSPRPRCAHADPRHRERRRPLQRWHQVRLSVPRRR